MIYFLSGFLLTLLSLKFIRPLLKNNFIAIPNERSSHKISTPSGGGISFVISFLIIIIIDGIRNQFFSNIINVFFASSLLALVGLFDDYYDLPRSIRFLSQFFVVILIISFSNFSGSTFFLQFLLGLIGISTINFFNFIDGIDGLLAGSMIVLLSSSIIFLSLPSVLWALVGGLILFLFFNWNPSNIFMGDSGSLFLGAIFFGISLNSNNLENLIRVFLTGSPIFFDTIICIIRRKFAGENIFLSHKKHLYQRLIIGGMSHGKVSTIYILSILFLSLINNFLNIYYLIFASICILIFGTILERKVSSDFN